MKKILNKKGQATVEFLLLMGTVITLVLTFMTLFHEKLAAVFFYLIGGIIG